MKERKAVVTVLVTAILVPLVFVLSFGAVLFGIGALADGNTPTDVIMDSVSPNGKYSVYIEGRMGTGLLNVPVHITIRGKEEGKERNCWVSTQIDNNNGGASANANVWTVWKDANTAVVILMGKEQWPEWIELTFEEEDTQVIRRQAPETSEEARTLLREFGINVDAVPEQYW